MDTRSRLLAVVVFCLFAAALVGAAYSLRQAARRTEQELARLQSLEQPRFSSVRSSRENTPSSRMHDFSNPRAEMMQAQVERLAARVTQLTEQLDKKTTENDSLRAELDKSTRVLNELLNPSPGLTPAEPEEAAPQATANAKTNEETVTELNRQLQELRKEIEALEKSAEVDELQILDLDNRRRYLDTAAATALVRCGMAAVPPLSDLLSDRRAEIRRWAATLLGEIGPDAMSAVDVLHEALSDSDEDVRLAARKALRRIEKP